MRAEPSRDGYRLDTLERFVGQELGVSDWLRIDQDQIDRFATFTGDEQWIHVDVERARRESPFGATIAHGYLVQFTFELGIAPGDAGLVINYGAERIRFPSPIKAGARVRDRVVLLAAEGKGPGSDHDPAHGRARGWRQTGVGRGHPDAARGSVTPLADQLAAADEVPKARATAWTTKSRSEGRRTMPTPDATATGRVLLDRKPDGAPPVDGDFYRQADLLAAEDRALLRRVRTFMEEKVAPIITRYWARAEFPFEVIPDYAALGITGIAYKGFGCPGRSTLLDGFVMLELARIDCSIATFFGVHSGLATGSIYLCGSEEQKQRWLPAMRRCEKIGAFGLTEPEVGSGVARGLMTSARRDGDSWILNGEKAWIGNATFADVTVIWARDVEDNQVKGFLVENGTRGFTTEKMERKIALRAVQNARIRLEDCRVDEANRWPTPARSRTRRACCG